MVEDGQTSLPFPLPQVLTSLADKVFQMVSSPLLEVTLWKLDRPGPLVLDSRVRVQLQCLNRKLFCPHMAEQLPVSVNWTFLHVRVSGSLGLEGPSQAFLSSCALGS